MTIPTIPLYTGIIPDRNLQLGTPFTINVIDWLNYQNIQIPATNVTINGFNLAVVSVNEDAEIASNAESAAQASANFKGAWSGLVGALAIPAAVEHNGDDWQLLDDLADVTLSEPSSSNSDWLRLASATDITALQTIPEPLSWRFAINDVDKVGAGSITDTRASDATIVDRYGMLVTETSNVLRTNELGALMEGGGSNFLVESETFLTSPWVQTIYNGGAQDFWTVTTASGDIQAFGNASGTTKFVATATPNQLFAKSVNAFGSSGIDLTQYVWIYVPTQGGISSVRIFSAYQTNNDIALKDFSTFDEWVLVDTSVLTTISPTEINFNIQPDISAPLAGFTFYIAVSQINDGTFAQSYIPTIAAPATRIADLVQDDVYNNVPPLSRPWAYAVKLIFNGFVDGKVNAIWSITTGGAKILYIDSSGGLVIRDDVTIHAISAPEMVAGEEYEILVVNDGANTTGYVNAGVGVGSTTSFIDVTTGDINYGVWVSDYFNGSLKDSQWYDENNIPTVAQIPLLPRRS
jgi:hypothetical protein